MLTRYEVEQLRDLLQFLLEEETMDVAWIKEGLSVLNESLKEDNAYLERLSTQDDGDE